MNNWAQRIHNCITFILQYAKLRMLEIYYKSYDKFCDNYKWEGLQMDTCLLNTALAEENHEDKKVALE